jgi:choline dehydrogenase-like flavoprotein
VIQDYSTADFAQNMNLLLLVGIGNRDIVSKAGVKSIVDLPGVGENLQDHTQLVLRPIELVNGFTTRDILNDPTQAAIYMDE